VPVDLLVPVKLLAKAKTRLRSVAGDGTGAPQAHARLVVALVRDTLAAATGAMMVRRAVVICSDEMVRTALAEDGVETIPDEPNAGLNSALRHGAAVLRAADPSATVGALQADLPALRSSELDCAIRTGLVTGSRAFCPDRTGAGTTLLIAPPGQLLEPRFGAGSAVAHRRTGAHELAGDWPGLQCDVDTAADLAIARALGLGRFTRAALAHAGVNDRHPHDERISGGLEPGTEQWFE
jgi:2-phospho-L-lactate/phosphoenolpyruvate guanylyltransferase